MNSGIEGGKVTVSKRLAAVLALVVGLAFLSLIIQTPRGSQALLWTTVASDGKRGGHGPWGFKIENHRGYPGIRLSFVGHWGLNWTFEHLGLSVTKVLETRWLDNDRAVYINASIATHDSGTSDEKTTKILYDFQRGELFVTSDLTLWRGWNWRGGEVTKNWRTEKEFNSILALYESKNEK